MLKLFRKDVFLQAFIIIILAGVLWSRSFVNQTAIPTQGGGYIYYQLAGWIPPIVATILGFILMLLEGFLLNMQLYKNKLINQNTLMPMLFYVIAMSLTTDQLTLTPILIGNLFIITCIDNLMLTSTYLSLPIGKTLMDAFPFPPPTETVLPPPSTIVPALSAPAGTPTTASGE